MATKIWAWVISPVAGIDDGHRAAGVVHEQLLAGNVDLAYRALLATSNLGVLDAKARVFGG